MSENPSEERSPVDRLLDVAVYAPLGLALDFRRVVPELAQAGRRQVAFSRSLGKAALSTIGKAAAARGGEPTSKTGASSTKPDASTTPTDSSTPANADDRAVIEGYDGLNAREIIALSSAASPAQRRWMRQREAANKKRKTVLQALGDG
ncbi:MAG: hypothetical protein AAF567_07970 [Actinomycetota bacterium]